MQFLMMLLRPKALLSGGALGLLVLLAYLGPSLGLSWLVIGIIAVAIVVLWVVILLIMRARANKAASELEDSLDQQAQSQLSTARPGREAEVEELRKGLQDAISALKTSRVGKSGGRSALYVLPWYMIIGPPASGKTTLLSNSGLNFPYTDAKGKKTSVRGVGGTRHCDWWFADEAVILDTAGRYTLPVEADDTQEWLSFLDLLGRYRKKKPINGLLVGVSVKDLLSGGEENVEKHATRIRARIDELIERLGISFPIYVVFTKCDLVRGFVEFFGNLSRAERAEVWGTTFGRDRIARSSAVDMFDEEMEVLSHSLRETRIPRLAEESNMDSRPEILFFPLQFDAIRRRLTLFIDTLFKENPYQEKPIFRGVYFTSGTQEGRPLDQVINAMLAGFGIGEKDEGMYVEPTQTKSYFIENVFSKIIFPDRHVAGPSVEKERKRRSMRVKVFVVGAVGLFLLFFALLGLSSLNRGLLNDTRELGSKAGAVASDDRLQLSLDDVKTIDGLRGKLDQIERKSSFGAKALLLGTSQSDRALPDARELYLTVLDRAVFADAVPALSRKLEDNADSLMVPFSSYFQWYRTWQILLDPGARLSSSDAPVVANQLVGFWDQYSGINRDEELQEYRRLIERQVAYASGYPDGLSSVARPKPPGADDVDFRARNALNRYWNADILYRALVSTPPGVDDMTVLSLVGANQGVVGQYNVPGTYTRAGWDGPVKQYLETVEGYRSDWALQRAFRADPPVMRGFVLAKYADDYVTEWLSFLRGVDLRKGDIQDTQAFLQRAASDKSPLLMVLNKVNENTDFRSESDPELVTVERSFASLRSLFSRPEKGGFNLNPLDRGKDEKSGGDLLKDEYLNKVREIATQYADIAKQSNPERSQPILALNGWVQTNFPENPDDPVSGEVARILNLPASAVTGQVIQEQSSDLQTAWQPVLQEFRQTLAGRYPFSSNGQDAALSDFKRFFGPGGTFDKFYQANLADKVSPDGQVLDSGVALNSGLLSAVRSANQIQQALFSGGDVSFKFSISPAQRRQPVKPLVPSIVPRGVLLSLGGNTLTYDLGVRDWVNFSWPGPNAAAGAELRVDAGSTASIGNKRFEGAWGFFRLLETAKIEPGEGGANLALVWTMDGEPGGVDVTFDVRELPAQHPMKRGFFRFSLPTNVTQ